MKQMRSRPGDEARAAMVRLRAVAPLFALTVPVVLLVLAGVMSASSGDDAALPWAAAASPMTALFVFLNDGASPGLLAFLITAIASAPLWSLIGVTIAGRTGSFAAFWRWYLLCSAAWIVVALLLVP